MSALCQRQKFIFANAGRIRLGMIGFWVVMAVGFAVPKAISHLKVLTIPPAWYFILMNCITTALALASLPFTYLYFLSLT